MIDNNAAPERLTEEQEIEALLPFFVTGRLEPSERDRVAAFLNRNAEVATHLKLVREENREIYDVNRGVIGSDPGKLKVGQKLTILGRGGAQPAPATPPAQPTPPRQELKPPRRARPPSPWGRRSPGSPRPSGSSPSASSSCTCSSSGSTG